MLWLSAVLALAPPTDPAAYALYDGQGRPASFAQLVDAMAAADVACFGELHDSAVAHWLQLELTRALHARRGTALVLGAEMLERDQQLLLDEYLTGTIRDKDFTAGTRLWPNYATDYAPLVNFARDQKLRFIATNVPRRYAALVARSGLPALDPLPAAAKALLPTLPLTVDLTLPSYQAMLQMGGHGGPTKPEYLVAAQALKDAAMAEAIHRHLPPGGLLLHYHGAYHSNRREGLVWYLLRLRPQAKVVVLSTVAQPTLTPLDPANHGLGEFCLVPNPTVPPTAQGGG